MQLQTVKQKLLTHDPMFWIEPTYCMWHHLYSCSAFMSTFWPPYMDGDVESDLYISILP